MPIDEVMINRAPVLTLWAAIVAERLGFTHDEAMTLGRAVAGLNAYSKGLAIGIFKPTPIELRRKRVATGNETLHVGLLNRAVPAIQTAEGLRALSKERPIKPASVEKYLLSKFKDALGPVSAAMTELANSRDPDELAQDAYSLYEQFRPDIPAGAAGWGATGTLSAARIRKLVAR